MTLDEITCGLCAKTYAEAEGCDICRPAKKKIRLPDPFGVNTSSDISALARQTERVLRRNLTALEKEMKEAENVDRFIPSFAKEACQLSAAITKLVCEARKLEDTEAQRVKKMTWEDKVSVLVNIYADFPQEYQALFQKQCADRRQDVAPITDLRMLDS